MTKILLINNSIYGNQGKSSALANAFVERMLECNPDAQVTSRDLAKAPVSHLSLDEFNAVSAPENERTPEQAKTASVADALIREVMEADVLVIGSPTYNFSISSSLKAWFDRIARAGTTFRYTPNGPEGLLSCKAYIFISSGGVYQGTDTDFQTSYIRHFLHFLGIRNIEFTYVEGVAMRDGTFDKSMQKARDRLEELLDRVEFA